MREPIDLPASTKGRSRAVPLARPGQRLPVGGDQHRLAIGRLATGLHVGIVEGDHVAQAGEALGPALHPGGAGGGPRPVGEQDDGRSSGGRHGRILRRGRPTGDLEGGQPHHDWRPAAPRPQVASSSTSRFGDACWTACSTGTVSPRRLAATRSARGIEAPGPPPAPQRHPTVAGEPVGNGRDARGARARCSGPAAGAARSGRPPCVGAPGGEVQPDPVVDAAHGGVPLAGRTPVADGRATLDGADVGRPLVFGPQVGAERLAGRPSHQRHQQREPDAERGPGAEIVTSPVGARSRRATSWPRKAQRSRRRATGNIRAAIGRW